MKLTSDATYLCGDGEFEVLWMCTCGNHHKDYITLGHPIRCDNCEKEYLLSDRDSPYEVKLVEI